MAATRDQRKADFDQLQKEYRLMEMNRKAYAEESQTVLRKQQSTLGRLRHDTEVSEPGAMSAALSLAGRPQAYSKYPRGRCRGARDGWCPCWCLPSCAYRAISDKWLPFDFLFDVTLKNQ